MSKKTTPPDEAFWRLKVAIKPGKLEDFLSVAAKAVLAQYGPTYFKKFR
jgi:hypothetical protein